MTFLDRSWRRHRARLPLAPALSALAWLSAPEAKADPKLRYQIDQRGDMILIGNTVGFDCRPGIPKPVVGTVDTSSCGTNLEDSSADVWWRDDAGGAGGAVANLDVKVPDARTTAVLQLPYGAKVTYARLYWDVTDDEVSPPDDKVKVGELHGQALREGLAKRKGPGPWNIELIAGSPDDANSQVFFDGAMSVLKPRIADGTLSVRSGQITFAQAATQGWKAENAQKRKIGRASCRERV